MKKRCLSLLLSLCMILSLLPAVAIPAAAAGGPDPVYNRAQPEAAIMNKLNGDQTGKLYTNIKATAELDAKPKETAADRAYFYYNLIDQGVLQAKKGENGSWEDMSSTKTYKGDWTTQWTGEYKNSVLFRVANAFESGCNLQYAVSATFRNEKHTHWWTTDYYLPVRDTVYARTLVKAKIGMSGVWLSGLADKKDTSITKSEGSGFVDIPSHRFFENVNGDFTLTTDDFQRFGSDTNAVCDCDRASISDTLFCFRDEFSPTSTLYFNERSEGNTNLKPANLSRSFAAGETIVLCLDFGEPIRFADDSAAGKGELYIGLKEQGQGEITKKAYLTKLDGSRLYFEYTVPTGNIDTIITGMDFSALQTPDQRLVHVVKNKSFSLPAAAGTGDGYDKVTGFITDLAGNPVSYKAEALKIVIDTNAPTITSVSSEVNANNAELKAFLNHTSTADNSDTYLSAGDSISFKIDFSEPLEAANKPTLYNARVTTNLYTGEGNNKQYVAVGRYYSEYVQMSDIAGSNGAAGTRLTTPAITITRDMKCDDSEIRVTAIEFTSEEYADRDPDKLRDKGGNRILGEYLIDESLNTNPKKLDSSAPTFGAETPSTNATYTPTATADWFCFPFTLSDAGGSGYAGAPVTMTLRNSQSPDYRYQYAISNSVTRPTSWTGTAAQGEAVKVAAIADNTMYLHVKTQGEGGILGGFFLDLSAQDYAGNTVSRTWAINWGVDVEKPAATAGTVTRSGTENKISVAVDFSDNRALRSASYQWTESTGEPGNTGWEDFLTIPENDPPQTTADAAASAQVIDGADFSKYLWVKTVDAAGNEKVQNLGRFTYNRGKPNILFAYNEHPARRPELQVTDMGGDNAAFVYFTHEGKTWGRFVNAPSGNLFEATVYPALGFAQSWNNYTVVKDEETGEYTFTIAQEQNSTTSIIGAGTSTEFTGSVTVNILTGNVAAFGGKTENQLYINDTITAGTDAYPVYLQTITLYAVADSDDDSPAFTIANQPEVKFTADESAESATVASPAGLRLTVTLPAEENMKTGCGYDMIDWENAKVLISKKDDSSKKLSAPLQKPVSTTGETVQTVVVPLTAESEGLAQGEYSVSLVLPFKPAVSTANTIPPWETRSANMLTLLVDKTEPTENFSIDSVTYSPAGLDGRYTQGTGSTEQESFPAPSALGFAVTAADSDILGYKVTADAWQDVSITRGIEAGVNYLPTASSESYARNKNAFITNCPYGTYTLNFSLENLERPGGFGKCAVVLQNSYQGLSEITADSAASGSSAQVSARVFADATEAAAYCGSNTDILPLIAGVDNVIALRLLYDNGRESAVRTVTLHPKTVMTWDASGANYAGAANSGTYFDLSVTDAADDNLASHLVGAPGSRLCLTPVDANKFSGLTLYAVNSKDETHTRKQFTLAPDGKYYVELDAGQGFYAIFGVDAYGGLTVFTDLRPEKSQQGYAFAEPEAEKAKYRFSAVADNIAPTVTNTGTDDTAADGVFTTQFMVNDDAILKDIGGRLHISLALGEAYAAAIGAPTGVLDLEVDQRKIEATGYDCNLWTPDGSAPHGIYKLTGRYFGGGYVFTVYGVAGSETVKPALEFSAVDAYGNTGSGAHEVNITAAQTVLTLDATDINVAEGIRQQTPVVRVTSNVPILPAESWITDGTETYGTEHTGRFPLTQNATEQEISYYDIFGVRHTQNVTVDQLGDFTGYGSCGSKPYTRGLDIQLSETAPTAGSVILTGMATDPSLYVYITEQELGNGVCYDDCRSGGMSLEVTENGTYYVYLVEKDQYTAANGYPVKISQLRQAVPVHIRNILNGTPTAEPRFYLAATGRDYSAAEIAAMKAANGGQNIASNGAVRVSYVSDRDLTPTGGTEQQHSFNPGGGDSYTFRFTDLFGNTGELSVDLSEYGIDLTAERDDVEAAEPDTEAPAMSVDIVMKRGDAYTDFNSFSDTDTAEKIEAAFENLGYAQSALLRVNVSDKSDFKLVLRSSDANTPTYASAESDPIPGVTLSGSTVTVGEGAEGSFTVFAVDKAGEYSSFTVDTAWITGKLDNTPPVVAAETVADGLYNKKGYVKATDDKTSVRLISPALQPSTDPGRESWYAYPLANGNGAYSYTFRDEAGNTVTGSFTVAGINMDKPSLTVKWMTQDGYTPTEPTNRNVVARLTSDIELKSLTVNYDSVSETLSATEMAYDSEADGLSIRFTADGAEITMSKSRGYDLSFTGVGKNGQTSDACSVTLYDGVIDKDAPVITETQISSTAGVAYRFTPNEPVYCLQSGETEPNGAPKIYDSTYPLEYTFTDNGEHTLRFTDMAGNKKDVRVTVSGIDKTAPVITLSDADGLASYTSGSISLTVTTDESCNLTCTGASVSGSGTSFTVTFTENNIYKITAKDAAGNESYEFVLVGKIDKTPPTIVFDSAVVVLRQGSAAAALDVLLAAGYTTSDNVTAEENLITVDKDTSGVDLNAVGVYPVTYTVSDSVNNTATAVRYVRVVDQNLPALTLKEGTKPIVTQPDGTVVLQTGVAYGLEVDGIKTLANGEQEPWKIKISRGLRSLGQMKAASGDVVPDANMKISFSVAGYYTVLITTQSRQTYRTLLYVRN